MSSDPPLQPPEVLVWESGPSPAPDSPWELGPITLGLDFRVSRMGVEMPAEDGVRGNRVQAFPGEGGGNDHHLWVWRFLPLG